MMSSGVGGAAVLAVAIFAAGCGGGGSTAFTLSDAKRLAGVRSAAPGWTWPPTADESGVHDSGASSEWEDDDKLAHVDVGLYGTVSAAHNAMPAFNALSRRYARQRGYILGEEGGGAFFGGLRYGEGMLYTKNAGDLKVFWQGPSVGWDFGGEGARTMMLVYKLPATHAIYQRFGGIDGSAYFIGGLGMTALTANNIVVVPIRSGLGLRLGANIGYLKFTPQPTWNPF